MTDKTKNLSRGKKYKSMLDEFLALWDMTPGQLAARLEINYRTLGQYRRGEREFRLNMKQIQSLQELLRQIGRDYLDLPLDWYLDKDQEEQTWDEPEEKN
ncbi:hypothetical protein [Gloeothece verrucosa]|uniref:HTH cro/C1-type domain-containing protein n=1 Tax=Gloeothece verrucosa (strain PCC 7822) TaxID=497965 RepID=E0UD19_GLOV7|nr:hypothetical protein [Gloeothece verrucosa]ADN16484.1 hypothetical protein Cyan7822_4575 [Gloeothece verrucosa PCC 7822]